MIRGAVFGFVSAVALFSTAHAADIYGSGGSSLKDAPVSYAPSWTGFYIGVNGGYGWANNNQLVDLVSNPTPYDGIKPEGGFGGGQIGYNWQVNSPLVLGIEADIQGSGIEGNRGQSGNPNVYHFKSNLDYFGTVRGRVGYSLDRTLFYVTGGFAYGGLQKSSDDSFHSAGGQKFDDTATGYVVGGGIEYKFNPGWSLKAEYQYLNFGYNDPCNSNFSHFPGHGCFEATVLSNNGGRAQKDDDYHTVRVGLNYHVGRTYETLK